MALGITLGAATASAQSFDPVTTRAAGMAGAFVAVTDDASAVYWNPAALASGAVFSLLIDRTSAGPHWTSQPIRVAEAGRDHWRSARRHSVCPTIASVQPGSHPVRRRTG